MMYPYRCTKCNTYFIIESTINQYTKNDIDKISCPLCKSKCKREYYSNGISIQYKDEGFTKFVKEE